MSKKDESIARREELVVSVDTEAMRDTIATSYRLAEENKDLKNKLETISRHLLRDKREALGAPDEINSLEELKLWEAEHTGATVKQTFSGGSSGRSSLNDEGQQSKGKTFDCQEDMINFVIKKANSTDADAEKYREINHQILDKVIKGNAEGKGRTDGFYEMKGGIKDLLNQMNENRRKRIFAEKKARGFNDES